MVSKWGVSLRLYRSKSSAGRGGVAHEVVERAEAAGIVREDIIIERLALTVGADTNSGLVVIEAVQRIKAELGVNLTVGASNVCFGLPDRYLLNNAFVVMAIAAGFTCLIVDVVKINPAIVAADPIKARSSRNSS